MLRVATADWGMITLDAFETRVLVLTLSYDMRSRSFEGYGGLRGENHPPQQIGEKGHRSESAQDFAPELCVALKITSAVP